MAKCNLGKVKIHPMLGSSFTKFRERGVGGAGGGGGGGSKGAYNTPVHVCAFCFTEACLVSAQFVFPSLPSQVS